MWFVDSHDHPPPHLTSINMRQNTTRILKQSTVFAARETGQPWAQRTPFICASCQASMRRSPPKHTVMSRRNLTTTPTRLQEKDSTPPQTHYDFFPQTFPKGPPPQSPFTPDLRQLRKEFLQAQAKAHPDLAPQDKKRHAEALSMRINEAYITLQDPLRRAQYLLAQQGIDVEDESAKLAENALLMEVMEAREAVEEVEDEQELVGLREENNERIGESVKVLEGAFIKGDLDTAAQEAIKLRYWMNIEESIHGWEKGVGGGVIHH